MTVALYLVTLSVALLPVNGSVPAWTTVRYCDEEMRLLDSKKLMKVMRSPLKLFTVLSATKL